MTDIMMQGGRICQGGNFKVRYGVGGWVGDAEVEVECEWS
jgi:hypothetical protein